MVQARWQRTIVDDAGNVLPNAQIEVRSEEAGASLATIYQDREGAIPLGNPFSANAAPFASDGFVWFHAPAGAYRITVTSGAFSRTHRYVGISLTQEQDSLPAGPAWRYDSVTADADPGAGLFRFNNADPASATAIYIDAQDKESVDQSAWLTTFDDGGDASERGILTLRSTDNAAVLVARVTGSLTINGSPPGYYSIPITVLGASLAAAFIAGGAFGFIFARSGADGLDADGDVTGPNGGVVAGQFAQFSDTAGKDIIGGDLGDSPPTPLTLADAAAVRQSAAGRMLQAGLLQTANALIGLSDSATIAIDWSTFINGTVTLGGNRTLGNPSNGIPGTWRTLQVIQDGTGSRTLAFGGQYIYPGGNAPTMSTAANARDMLMIYCLTASSFIVFPALGIS